MKITEQQEIDEKISQLERRIERLEELLVIEARQKQKDSNEPYMGHKFAGENQNINALGVATIAQMNGVILP